MKTYQELKEELKVLNNEVIHIGILLFKTQESYRAKLIECDKAYRAEENNEELAKLEKLVLLRKEIYEFNRDFESYDVFVKKHMMSLRDLRLC